jgi:hypothetical protein
MGTLTLYSGQTGGTAYRRPPFFKTKKLGILGRTQNIAYTPWHDPTWTLASHTSAREMSKREPDWYFDLHRPECFTNENKSWNPKYYTWLKNLQVPIFMQETDKAPWNTIPMAVRYPIEQILQEHRAYFTNHCAYMIALAMSEGVETIGLFGCQYGAGTEYSTQRGSLEYWLGRFEQYGGNIVLPVKSNTLLCWPSQLYGYESHDDKGKLVGGYADGLKFKKTLIQDTANKPVELTIAGPDTKPPANMPVPPDGEPIAWDRRALLFPETRQ